MNRFQKTFLSVKELGLKQLVPYAVYQFKLQTGILEHSTPVGGWEESFSHAAIEADQIPFPLLDKETLAEIQTDSSAILANAEQILRGEFNPFGGAAAPLSFALPQTGLKHWTQYGSTLAGQDIKLTWEPARFTWVYPLIEAHTISGDDRYAACFWQHFDEFVARNPVNSGPNWASAQEVALRVLPLICAWRSFQNSPSSTNGRQRGMQNLLLQSARRIPPTLAYSRSQKNNHLLSEALGLIMLGTFFAGIHPLARQWEKQGEKTFEGALRDQIEANGTYSQHSTNYHRLLLQLALVYYAYAHKRQRKIADDIAKKLAAATRWLASQTDSTSGAAPNLGHNDGSLFLPFGATDYHDFRPTVQAASLAFLGKPAFSHGPWDALSLWLGLSDHDTQTAQSLPGLASAAIQRVGPQHCWGTLRAVQFHSRPAHADQLTVDLWWQGINIALDAGTFLYNGAPLWENSLAQTCVHNTITLNGQDQMLRGGRFLWLNRVNAQLLPQPDPNSVAAFITTRTDPPLRHERTLTFVPEQGFTITDELTPLRPLKNPLQADLQWLLPDWEYSWVPQGIQLSQNERVIQITLSVTSAQPGALPPQLSLIRAGEVLMGEVENPIRGWVSPTYNQKIPALSLGLRITFSGNVRIITRWQLISASFKTG